MRQQEKEHQELMRFGKLLFSFAYSSDTTNQYLLHSKRVQVKYYKRERRTNALGDEKTSERYVTNELGATYL